MPSRSDTAANQPLNEMLVILHRSLAVYLHDATPWVAYGNGESKRVLDRIVADKHQAVARLTALLDSRRHTIGRGEFPMEFTSLHDMSLEYLVHRLIEHQRFDIQAIESRISRLKGDRDGQPIAEQILAEARRHLQSLEALSRQPASA